MQVAGDRGLNYNAFTLFLIFILLYLAQKGTSASAYSESSQDQANQPETSAENQVAVGLSNGDIQEYTQEPVYQPEQSLVYEEPALEEEVSEDYEEVQEAVVEDYPEESVDSTENELEPETTVATEESNVTEVLEEEVVSEVPLEEAPVEQVEEQVEELPEELPDAVEPEQEVAEQVEEVEEPFMQETPEELPEPTETMQEDLAVVDQEMVEVSTQEEACQPTTEEPVLGGQSNLFLKPTVMAGVASKEEKHSGPKINFRFGQ